MTGDRRIQDNPWQGRIGVLLLILALIAVPAVALGGTDLPSNTTEPTTGVPGETPRDPGDELLDPGEEGTTLPEPTPTETVEDEVTPAAAWQLPQYAGTDADIATPGASTVIPSNNDVLLQISNDGNARFNDYGDNTYHFFSPGQSSTQGMNALHITTDPVAEAGGQITFSESQSGVFYLTDTGGRGWDDNAILMLAVNGTIPDSFRINIRASGYQWTPVLTGTYPTFDDVTYVPEALDETFTKDDFLYGPQIWRPCAAANYPIFDGQDMTDTENTFSILFIDLNAGILGANTLSQPSFAGQSVTDNGAIKVEYSFENLPTFAAFDAYAYTVSSNQGQGIRWTNRLSAAGSSGYAVLGQPLPEAPIADFTANVTSGEAPLAVLFTDASTDTPTSWAWDFEDDGTVDSIEQNPVHTYTAAGTYTVNLTVANDGGSDTEVKTDYITVTEPTGPSEPAPLPAPRHIFFKVANDAGVKYNLDSAAYGGPNGTYYIKADGGGLNELHITNDADAPYGQVASGEEQSGTLWITNTGGRGFDDDIIILISVNGTIPDDFALHIKSSGYTWTPSSTVNAAPTDYTYVEGALNETFTKEDFIYGPQTWKPGPGDLVVPSLPLYYGQDINDQSASSYLMFVDLNVGNMYPSKFPGATLTDDGGAKVEFTFTNLTTHAAFNAYGWCLAANQGQGISWTNRVSGTGSSGYTVTGVPYVPPSAPVADFAANVTSGDAPLVVQFTDASTGDPTSWAWDFENDGIVDSTEQSPVHTYTAADTYSVNLTVTNAGGSDTEVKTGYIQVSPRLSRTWTVGASGCDFTTLMDAINSASVVDGDTVYVYNGTYSFTTSTKAVTVMGENTERVTLDLGATTGYIRGNGATFEKLRFTNGRLQLPSLEPVAQNILVRDCIFEGMLSTTSSMSGSILVRGQNCAFENNTFRNNVIGTQALVALYSSNLRWENNTFTATTGAGAAVIRITQSAANVLIKNNRFSANTMPCISFMANTGATPANKVYLNDFIVPAGVTPIAKTGFGDVPTVSWTTSGVIPYTYQGTPQTGILGNYWSPYNGTDANSDGIGDTPYDTGLLNDNNPGTNPANVDPAPLMAPVADYFGSAGPAAPVAAFSANVTNGTAPLTVAFTDASTGDPTSWVWDFEDDGIVDSTEQSPVHTYTAAGTYTVNLTVANAGGSDAEIKTGYITVTEPTGPSVLPGYNNIFVKVANDLGVKYNAFDNNTYNIRFEGIGRGLNALHISTDPAVNFGQVTVSENQSGTFYATDSGGKGYEDEIILMVAVNGTIPDDFRLRVRADGYTWTPNPERNRAPSLDNVIYQASSLDEVFTKEDFIYGPQIWKPTGNEADYPIYAGQDMTNTENTFRIMFIDLNAGVLRPNETLENRGAVRITYAFENLESFAAFNVYAYCKNSNNGDDMIAWGNALTSDKAMSGYSVIGTDSGAPAGSAWPMYGHDLRHTGLSPYTGPEFPVKLWSYKAKSFFYVQPVLDADGTVYAGSRDKIFYAINQNGTLKWSYTTPNQIYTAAAIDSEGNVYFGNRDMKIYAMNPDGTVKWTFTTGGAVSSAPAIGTDGTIYAGSADMKLYAVNPDGTEKWAYTTGGAVNTAPAIGADGTIYVGSADSSLYAMNPDGTLKWSYATGGAVNTAPAIGADGTIYIGSADGSLYAINPDGTPKWSYATGGAVATPAIGPDGTIYAGSASKTINAVNPDGTLKWFYTTTGTLTTAPAIDAAGTVYIASSDRNDRYLYAIRSDGTLKWKFLDPVSPRFFDTPSIGADGTIYIGSSDSNVYAIGSTDTPTIASVAIDPADIELSRGLVQQFLALATDTSGTVLANLAVDWSSSNETVGTVNATGFFTALAPGTTNLSATYGEVTGTANITIIPPVPVLKVITVSPAEKSVFVGDNWTFAATPLDQYDEPMDGVLCTWTSSNTTVGTVDETGTFTALIAGTTTLTAANGTVSGNATVTVLDPEMLTAITISPSPASLTVGEGLQFNATAVNQYNTTIDGLAFTWTCSDTSAGTVNETGYFASLTYGRADVTAAIGAVNATVPVTVLPQSPLTWTVDNSGGADFTSIQAAVDAAFDGDTIVVGDGMYSESVTVTKPLTLRSENGPEKTKIAPTSTYGVTVLADNSTVSGFGISGTSGINCRYYSGCTLTDNIIAVSKTGIYVQGANNILVDGNVINGSTTLSIALMCASICDSVISNNTCRDSAQGLAIQTTVQSSAPSNITVTGNVIASNNYGLFLDGVENSRFDHNIVTGNTYGIRMQSGPSNTLFANTVVNNSNTLDYPSGQANTWSSPDPVTYTYNGVTYTGPIGNYWGASYPIDDMDDNGIGDAGIALYTNNVDNYPLVLPAGAYFGEPYDDIPIPTTMEVSPSSVVMVGETQQQFTGTVYDQNGRVMTGAGFAWSSSDEKVGPITGGGLFTAVYAGNTTITGQCYTLRDTADVFVNRTVLETVWIDSCESTDGWTLSNAGLRDDVVYEGSYSIGTPKITANASVEKVLNFPEGAAQMRFQLYGVKTAGCWIKAFIDGEEVAVATNMNRWITYAVDISGYEAGSHTFAVETLYSNPAGYSNQGVGFYLDQIEMRVNASAITPGIASIAVEPASVNLTNGETQQFSAVAYDAEGAEVPDVSFAWSSSNASVGSLSETGLFTAHAPGTTTVTAAYGNLAGTAVVTVTRPQGDQTQNTPLDIPGCNVTTGNDGRPQVSINTTAANATVAGNTIRIAEGNFTLTIETEGAPTNESGTVNGTIANIRLDTNPVVTELGSVGTVSASVSANLTGIPQGAGLTTTVSQNVSADAQSAFQLAASADGLALGDVAYTLNIVKTNLDNGQDIAGATIRMAVSPAWVTAHGGVDAIRIIRSAEDGTKEVLATTLIGTDADGNLVFEAVSPNGLSIFGLAAATAAAQPTQASSSSGGSSGTSTAVGAASNLKPGESATLPMRMTAVSAVTLTAKTDVKDAMVTVASGTPSRAAEPPVGTVYQYVQTTLYRASDDDFSGVHLRFAVPASWLTAQGCTAEQVTLFRYADGAWQAVPVEALGEENGNAVFSAASNGFGLFAIAVTEQVPGTAGEATLQPTAAATPVATVAAQAAGSTPTPQATPLPVWAAILAFGLLFFVRRT